MEKILPRIARDSLVVKRSLDLLWDYHDVLQAESQETTAEYYHHFVRSATPEELTTLLSTIRSCGDLILKHLKSIGPQSRQVQRSDRIPSPKEVHFRADTLAEMIVVKGPEFISDAVTDMSLNLLREFEEWTSPGNKRALSRLTDELRWQRKLALLKDNALMGS